MEALREANNSRRWKSGLWHLRKEERNILVVDWRKKDELVERFGNHIVKEVKEKLEWRW